MASLKTLFYLGVCLCAWIITTADINLPAAENLHWVSNDFKTILKWTTKGDKHTVLYTWGQNDWNDIRGCIGERKTECDLTDELQDFDRPYMADIRTVPEIEGDQDDPEDYPHTESQSFNPYKESNISIVSFTVQAVDESTVRVNITDTLSGIHRDGKQLSIRDIFKKDLQYKISYSKQETTGKREIKSDSSVKDVSGLDAGYSYCFMVAAFIPSRAKAHQQGPWSPHQCTAEIMKGLSGGVWVGIVFISLTAIIITITVTVLCCRHRRHGSKRLQQSTQTSGPV